MKLSFALFVSTTTTASMAAAVEDAPPSWMATFTSGATSSLLTGIHHHPHHHPHASTHVRESLPRSDDTTAAVVVPALLHNEEHTSSGGSKNVDVDVGLLPISERYLDFVQEDCAFRCNPLMRPVIKQDGPSFRGLLRDCFANARNCPDYNSYNPYVVPIGCWDTSEVKDMANAFYESRFDDSINCWNTASVTTMANMFRGATDFNQPLNDWDVASVTNMRGMFELANVFNQPLDDWNVSSVTQMYQMFNGQYGNEFNQPLDDWDVASVNDMRFMFYNALYFNQPLNDWNVSSVTDMYGMFMYADVFNQCLSSWADKTPYNVNVDFIFIKSGCPNKNTGASISPWCQGKDEQCIAPRTSLTNIQKKNPKKSKK